MADIANNLLVVNEGARVNFLLGQRCLLLTVNNSHDTGKITCFTVLYSFLIFDQTIPQHLQENMQFVFVPLSLCSSKFLSYGSSLFIQPRLHIDSIKSMMLEQTELNVDINSTGSAEGGADSNQGIEDMAI